MAEFTSLLSARDLYRHELKYVINPDQYGVIGRRVSLLRDHDRNAPDGEIYAVSSLYFDDYQNSALKAKLCGVTNRKKFRIRIYNGSDEPIKLERKVKRNGGIRKDSVPITRTEYDRIMDGNPRPFLDSDDPVKNDFLIMAETRRLRPKVVVSFQREAYTYRWGDVRIVFDSLLRTSISHHDLFASNICIDVADRSWIILEVKYTGFLPDPIRTAINIGSGHRVAVSKFAECMAIATHYNQRRHEE